MESIERDQALGPEECIVPDRFDTYDKYMRKVAKLKDHL